MTTSLPEPQDASDRKLLADVARVGWAVFCIPENEEGPGWAFSVGLYHTFGHPEVVVIGLPLDVSGQLVNNVGKLVKAGGLFEAGREYEGISEDYPDAFVNVDRVHYRDYFGFAGWFYRGWDFPVLQMVWCDRERVWPWDGGKPEGYGACQPALGTFVAVEGGG